jgi:endoglucanase
MPEITDPFKQNIKLGNGINLGNALEAPNEGEWGLFIKEEYFTAIKNAGFNSVRIPIKWSAHSAATSPFTIDTKFFERIDWVIDQALINDLAIIINIHHYTEMMENPLGHKDRFLSIWGQIAERYKSHSSDLFFEILNEPNNLLTADLWNQFLLEAIIEIRKTNPDRTLLAGTANWGGISGLKDLVLPDDNNIIVSFHYYNPFRFTHQGAEWVDGSDAWLETKWTNSSSEREAILNDFNEAILWAKENNVPLNLGEFGSYNKADLDSRYFWTIFVSQIATLNNISWHYWEFGAGFGVYDITTNQWHEKLLSALIPLP